MFSLIQNLGRKVNSIQNGLISLCIAKNTKLINTNFRSFCVSLKETKISVKGYNINHLVVGSGPHPVLLIPGACGSIWTDFKPQVENLNREKFTVVAWDPPGYGNSRPPEKKFTLDFYQEDAEMGVELMKALNFEKYSLLGWSDGGIVAMIIAGTHQEKINKMAVWGSNAYIVQSEVNAVQAIRDVSKWSANMREPLEKVYGKEYFSILWNQWIDAYVAIFEKRNGDICKSLLPKISCPTLILHGTLDPMVAPEHFPYLLENIKGSQSKIFKDGKHNIHLKYAKEFNQSIEDFLTKT